MIRVMLSAFVAIAFVAGIATAQPAPSAQGGSPEKGSKPTPSQDELDQQFAATMSGATLVGNFTTAGQDTDKPLKTERYTLGKVSKLKNGLWLFETRIQYGERDVKLPLALQVKWAGDTPVITLTDATFPGLGTYTARVLIYRGQYAGTWSAGDHGGELFGKIVPAEPDRGAPAAPAPSTKTDGK